MRKIQLVLSMLIPAAAIAAPAGDGGATVTRAGPGGPAVRVDALDPHIVRIWHEPKGVFARDRSLAMRDAPTTTVPLTQVGSGESVELSTGVMQVRIDRRTLQFGVADNGVPLVADARVTANADGTWTLTHAIGADERLMGLGEDNQNGGRLNRRGTIRELWAGQKIESGNVTAQYPVPFLLSTGRGGHAYGIFFDNVHRLRFDLGKTQADQIRCEADGGEIDLYVIDGPTPADVLERYTRLTGRPSLPPLWALGYWQSKCTYYDWQQLDEAYRQLVSRRFPVDVMVIDADWPEVITSYTWARRWVETARPLDPAGKIADYAGKGVRIVMSQSGPMVRQDSPTFASGWTAGIFATDGKGNPVECGWYGGKLLDFTHPRINDWLWPQTRKLNEQGIAGWWLDLDEPEGEPPQTHYHAGGPAEIHNQFSLLCAQSFEGVQLSVHPNERPFILSRCGPAGLQRFQAAVWTGDITSDYPTFRAHPPEMLNSGLSGLAWWTCDTGGFLTGYYKNDQFGAHARLYERWMQFSAFSPITRAHKAGGAPEPYAFGPATEQSSRHYLQLRYRLLPYIYSYAWEASRRGLPLVRPLALEYPTDPKSVDAPGDEYLFGRELLVAPVLHEGQVDRTVYFPPGRWIDWDYGYEYAGGRTWAVAAPLNRIPVAVRAGAIIPMAPEMSNTAEKPWDPLTLEVFPSGHSEFTLYRDDGVTFNYRQGASTVTTFTCDEDGRSVRFALDESNKQFAPQQYQLRLHLDQAPLALQVDDRPLPGAAWSWDEEHRILMADISAGAATRHLVSVELASARLPLRPAPEIKLTPIDPKGEASGSAGKPTPHFFPAPPLPARLKAVNYDNGGEGVAFHSTETVPPAGRYRGDGFRIHETTDAGGGYVLAGLAAGEWARYAVDCGNGGSFDLVVRAASATGGGRLRFVELDRTVATVDVPATGGNDAFRDFAVRDVYLSPGEQSLLMMVDAGGCAVNTIEFRPATHLRTLYPAELARRAGVAELVPAAEGGSEASVLTKLGRIGSSATFGVMSVRGGDAILRLRYRGSAAKPLPFTLKIDQKEIPLLIAPTGGQWQDLDLPVALQPGANRVTLSGLVDGWDAITLQTLEVIPK